MQWGKGKTKVVNKGRRHGARQSQHYLSTTDPDFLWLSLVHPPYPAISLMDLALPNILPDVLTSNLHWVIHLLIQQECTDSLPGSYTVWELPLCASLILAFSDVPSIPWLIETSCLTLAQCISLTDVQVGPALGLFHVGRIRKNLGKCDSMYK